MAAAAGVGEETTPPPRTAELIRCVAEMADKNDLMVDGKPLSSLRVVDLKQELEKRGMSKSGSKKDLADRLRTRLELELLQQHQEVQKVQEESPHVPNLSLTQELGDNNDFVRSYLAQQQQEYQQQIEIKHQVMSQITEEKEKHQMPASTEPVTNIPQSSAPVIEPAAQSKPQPLVKTDEKVATVEETAKRETTPPPPPPPPPEETLSTGGTSSSPSASVEPAKESMQVTDKTVTPHSSAAAATVEDNVAQNVGVKPPADEQLSPTSKQQRSSPRKSPRGSSSVAPPSEPVEVSGDQPSQLPQEKDETAQQPQIPPEEEHSKRQRDPQPELQPEPAAVCEGKGEPEPETEPELEQDKSQDESSKTDSGEIASLNKADDSPPEVSTSKLPRPKRKWGSSRTERPQRQGITTGELNNLLPSKEKVSRMASQDETAGSSGDVEESSIGAGGVAAGGGGGGSRGSSETTAANTTFSGKFSGNKQISDASTDGGQESGVVVSVTEGKTATADLDSTSYSANGSALISSSSKSKVHLSPSESTEASATGEAKGEKEQSPAKNPVSPYVFICNLTRPFTLKALQGLLSKFGTISTEHFWIDKIKSKCIVEYDSVDNSQLARKELHGLRWPDSNPKTLTVEFSSLDELQQYKLAEQENKASVSSKSSHERGKSDSRTAPTDKFDVVLRSTNEDEPENDSNKRQLREWDKDKVHAQSSPKRTRRSSGNEKADSGRGHEEKKVEKEAAGKLLDDLFRKTSALPVLYWLPLNEEEAEKRVKVREEKEKKRRQEYEAREERLRGIREKRNQSPRGVRKNRSPPFRGQGGRGYAERRRSPRRHSRSRSRSRSPAWRGGGGGGGAGQGVRRRSRSPLRRASPRRR